MTDSHATTVAHDVGTGRQWVAVAGGRSKRHAFIGEALYFAYDTYTVSEVPRLTIGGEDEDGKEGDQKSGTQKQKPKGRPHMLCAVATAHDSLSFSTLEQCQSLGQAKRG